MPIGTVKWFDNRKGWGFVIQPDGSDLFVHYTSIVGDGFRRLDDGAKVEYELEEGPKGPQAGNVRVLEDGVPAPKDAGATGTEPPAGETEAPEGEKAPAAAEGAVEQGGDGEDAVAGADGDASAESAMDAATNG